VSHLGKARSVGVKKGFWTGFSIGFLYLCIFAMYALSFWYGTTLVIAGEISVGDLTTTFFGVLFASFALGTVSILFVIRSPIAYTLESLVLALL